MPKFGNAGSNLKIFDKNKLISIVLLACNHSKPKINLTTKKKVLHYIGWLIYDIKTNPYKLFIDRMWYE